MRPIACPPFFSITLIVQVRAQTILMENDQKNSSTDSRSIKTDNAVHRKTVNRDYLANKLNYINFNDGTVLLNFKHTKYNHTVSIKAKPEPCLGKELVCIWSKGEEKKLGRLASYTFQDIHVTNGKNVIIINPVDIHISAQGAHLPLPETCEEIESRKHKRYPCEGINAQLIQNSVSFRGKLVNFNAVCFHVNISEEPAQMFFWINSDMNITLILTDTCNMFYAGECRIFKKFKRGKNISFILEPVNDQCKRFKPKDFRTLRQQLIPSPHIVFLHPLTQKRVELKILDLSGSGLSVEEKKEDAVLIPGMILPEVEINFAGSFSSRCKVQVVYRNDDYEQKNKKTVKCGMAILDMDIEEHGKLLALLYQAKDGKSFLSNPLDLDELWSFFFETGFIYPKKYAFLQENKEAIKHTYDKIYSEPLKIAKHFIYRDNNRILGHMAMIRFYVNSWMIHHHAANRSVSNIAGVDVLDQISRFIHESHRIFSNKMDYVFCYYRPENKFPSHVFGGITQNIANPKMCSLDTFAYYHFEKSTQTRTGLKDPWHLVQIEKEDLSELEYYYEANSGGLMLNALEMVPEAEKMDDLIGEYNRLGFTRKKHVFALKKENILKAVILINVSDMGLNLADLTNGFHLFVVDGEDLSRGILDSVLSELGDWFQQSNIPVLLYPQSHADEMLIAYEKKYTLWVVEVEQSDPYFKYLRKFIKRVSHLQSF